MCKQKDVNTNSFHDMHNMTKNGPNIHFNKFFDYRKIAKNGYYIFCVG